MARSSAAGPIARRTLDRARATPPTDPDRLWEWVRAFTGIRLARAAVCDGHHAPFDAFASAVLDLPAESLWLGSRGSGKSFMAALATHIRSRFHPRHGTRILGGSKAQSKQIYGGLTEAVLDGRGPSGWTDRDTIAELGVERAKYKNGSIVEILAASPLSVRGPHVPDLRLDEVDEIDSRLRQDAYGMAMAKGGTKSTILLTSTWHNVGGPMTELVERAESEAAAGTFPLFRFCLFEVLERCPDERSGAHLEHCPACPLVQWCHDVAPGRRPKAKRSSGHYAIDSAIQKARGVSPRAFAADYLCSGPKADGLWFADFDDPNCDAVKAAFDPRLKLNLAIDPGHVTAAVFFQVREVPALDGPAWLVTVPRARLFEEEKPEAVALSLKADVESHFGGRLHRVFADPAGDQRNGTGVVILGEYERVGLKGLDLGRLERWPNTSVVDSLATVEALVRSADGTRSLFVHPGDARPLVQALRGYRRARRRGQWLDQPEDPQHPHEDLVDALRGGLKVVLPRGRKPAPRAGRASSAKFT